MQNSMQLIGKDQLQCLLHQIQEPGRSALALLHLRLFDPDQIAVILGKTEKELPAILTAAREEFSKMEAPLP